MRDIEAEYDKEDDSVTEEETDKDGEGVTDVEIEDVFVTELLGVIDSEWEGLNVMDGDGPINAKVVNGVNENPLWS